MMMDNQQVLNLQLSYTQFQVDLQGTSKKIRILLLQALT